MTWLGLGDVAIDRIVDQDPLVIPQAMMFPALDWSAVDAYSDALGAEHIDRSGRALLLSVHSYLLRTPRANVLIDTCIGNHKRTGVAFFDGRASDYLARLAARGLGPEDIDAVLCTHLHADHVGWNTRLADGRWVPTFPNARYIFARRELDYLESRLGGPDHGTSFDAVYRESVLPILESRQADLVASDHELEAGLWLEPAPGHTPGNVVVHLVSAKRHGIFTGDVVHHPVLVREPGWQPVFCADPQEAADSRARLLDSLADTDTLMLPAHFRGLTTGYVRSDGERLTFAFERA